MSLYKVLIVVTKSVPMRSFGHTYNEMHRAYSDYQYFTSLEKAQAFCQKYSEKSLEWEFLMSDCWSSEPIDGLSFNIYLEKGSMVDTDETPPLPTDLQAFNHIAD